MLLLEHYNTVPFSFIFILYPLQHASINESKLFLKELDTPFIHKHVHLLFDSHSNEINYKFDNQCDAMEFA